MNVETVQYILDDLICLVLESPIRVDSSYYLNPANYVVQAHSGSPIPPVQVVVLQVLAPEDESLLTKKVYLHTTSHANGAEYEANFVQFLDATGAVVLPGANCPYQARISKTGQMLKSLPSHFDRRVSSLIRNLITAVSSEDDIIGGSRSDEFP